MMFENWHIISALEFYSQFVKIRVKDSPRKVQTSQCWFSTRLTMTKFWIV